MEDAGFIFGSYAVAGGAIGLYAWWLVTRIRRTTEELDGGGEQSWT
ncbi:MAG: hypothetical protein AAFZ07_21310 [Actinomycetota bacterium]